MVQLAVIRRECYQYQQSHYLETSENMTDSTLAFTQDLAYQLYESTEQYPVNMDDAWTWLGYAAKKNGKESFINCSFTEGEDFCRLSGKTSQGGRPSESIYLTVDCFKTWGMMAKTEQGKLIRRYFLECEKIAKEKQANLSLGEQLLLNARAIIRIEQTQREQEALNQKLLDEQRFHDIRLDHHDSQIIGLNAEVGRYSNGIGNYYSILAWARILEVKDFPVSKASKLGKAASKLCKVHNVSRVKTRDPRFGYVWTYPEFVLEQLNFELALA